MRLAGEGVAIALVLAVHGSGGGPAEEGLFVAAWSGAGLLSGFVAGPGLDLTARPARLLSLASVILAAALGLDGAAIGRLPAAVMIAVTAAGGTMVPLFTGGLSSILASMVPATGLARAQALDSATYSVAGIAGPALIALLAAVFSARVAMAAPAAAVLLGTAALPLQADPAGPRSERRRPRSTQALAALARTRELVACTASSTLAAFGWGGLEIGAVAVAALDAAPQLAGVYLAVMGSGALAAALALARRPLREPDRAIPLALALMAASGVLIARSDGAPSCLIGFAGLGLGDGLLLVSVFAIRARDAPTGMRAAVFTTAASLKIAAGGLGAAAAGLALPALGGRGLFYALAATEALAAVIGLVLGAASGRGRRGPLFDHVEHSAAELDP